LIKKIIQLIEPQEFKKFLLLIFLFILLGFVEVVGVGSVIPFLNSLSYSDIEESDRLTKFLYALFNPEDYKEFLLITGSLVIFLLITSNFLRAFVLWYTSYFVWNNQATMSINLLRNILNKPYANFLSENSAELSKDVLAETQNFISGLLLPLLTIISQSVICFAIIVALGIYDLKVSLIAISSILFIFGIFFIVINKPIQRKGVSRFQSTNARFKIVDESLSGIKLIKLLNKEDYFVNLLRKPSYDFASAMAFQTFTKSLPRYVFEVIAFGGVILLALVNIYYGNNINEVITIVGLFAFAGYRLLPSMSQLYQAFNDLTFNNIVLERLLEQGLSKANNIESKKIVDLGVELPEYSFENVSFSYEGTSTKVLKDININVSGPIYLAIVGSTGSGKSTFIDILLGLLEPTDGKVLLNGNDVNHYKKGELSDLIGYVPQDIYLVDATIKQNIALGFNEEEIDQDNIERAAKLANIHDFIIENFDDGYESNVGERGVKLSGGQIQRIGIARALYNKPKIVILDEGTSNLDQITESSVISSLINDQYTHILISVAHRLKITTKCDNILVFNNGKIEDMGTYKELSESNLIFKSMIES
jgi:ATP-binding cassette, subfamily B, bacterial PglK